MQVTNKPVTRHLVGPSRLRTRSSSVPTAAMPPGKLNTADIDAAVDAAVTESAGLASRLPQTGITAPKTPAAQAARQPVGSSVNLKSAAVEVLHREKRHTPTGQSACV